LFSVTRLGGSRELRPLAFTGTLFFRPMESRNGFVSEFYRNFLEIFLAESIVRAYKGKA